MKKYEYMWLRSEKLRFSDDAVFESWKDTCNELGQEGWQLTFLEVVRTQYMSDDLYLMFVGMFMREIE